jgi:hypothetical protein
MGAGAFTEYFVDKLLDHTLRGVVWAPPTAVYLKLFVGYPGRDGTANAAGTATRELVTLSASAGGRVLLVGDLTYLATARESITHVGGFDGATGGNCLFVSELDEVINISVGDTFDLPTLSIQIPVAA